jgi:hypothetical protein
MEQQRMTSTAAGTDSAAVDFVRFVYDHDRGADWGDGWFSESEDQYREHGPAFRARVVVPESWGLDGGGYADLAGLPFTVARDEGGNVIMPPGNSGGPNGVFGVRLEKYGDKVLMLPGPLVALAWDEYRVTYGDADNYATFGVVGLQRCECCGAARIVDSVWGFDVYTGPVPAGCDADRIELPDAVEYRDVERCGREYGRDDAGWVADYFQWR